VLCTSYVGGWDDMVCAFELQPSRRCLEPLCFLRAKPGKKLLRWCQRGILQYALIRPLVTIASVVLLAINLYDDGAWRADRGWLWMTILNNLGVTISLYFLVLFYQLAKSDLAPYKPLIKFGVIKGIVFFCYWQSVAIMGIVALGWVPSFRDWDNSRKGTTLQNMLICFEMVIFAFLHLFAFPYDIYQVGTQSQAPLVHEFELNRGVTGIKKGVKDSVSQKDMVKDTFDAYAPGSVKKQQIKRQKNKLKRADRSKVDDDWMIELEEDIDNLNADNQRIKKTARR